MPTSVGGYARVRAEAWTLFKELSPSSKMPQPTAYTTSMPMATTADSASANAVVFDFGPGPRIGCSASAKRGRSLWCGAD